jgi:low temperature requirement protein LtrA
VSATREESEKAVEPLELFFDLVFVFALTQVTARLSDDLSWGGLVRGLLVLAAIWWAWAAYAWLTNEVDTRKRSVRLVTFFAMASMLLASLAVPGAFEGDALLFAVAYLGVRLAHIGLFAAATDDVDVQQAARALATTAATAPLLLIVASAFDGAAQVAIWIVALAIDYVGGALRGIEGWRLSPGHFAERHGLIVIIALGESIVAIGVGAEGVDLDAGALAAATLGILLAAALWWTYFDGALEDVAERLGSLSGRTRNTTARDSFSFLHLPLVAGIVLLALGIKKALGDVDEPLKEVAAFGLCGGVAGYLAADVAFRRRCLGLLDGQRLVAAAAALALTPLAVELPALASLACVCAVSAALVAYEALRPARAREKRPAPGSAA